MITNPKVVNKTLKSKKIVGIRNFNSFKLKSKKNTHQVYGGY
jgi:nucleoid DNA-binding protein